MQKGKIFDIKQFAVHDGPGVRTTVFFKGCPLNCWWCHNPEGIEENDELFFYGSMCMACEDCVSTCTEDAIQKKDGKIIIDRMKCNLCGRCAEVCPTASLRLVGKTVTVDEVMSEIKKSRIFFDSSKGGVTLSGGEPFHQYEFMKNLIEACKDEDIHVTLDTCGHVKKEYFNAVIDDVDLFLFDLKLIDDKLHKKYTGISNKNILKNLRNLLGTKGKDVIIRFPVIPGVTDTEENIENLMNFLSHFKNILEIDLLPYHDVEEKFDKLGKEYRLPPLSLSNDKLKDIKRRFESEGYRVKIGG